MPFHRLTGELTGDEADVLALRSARVNGGNSDPDRTRAIDQGSRLSSLITILASELPRAKDCGPVRWSGFLGFAGHLTWAVCVALWLCSASFTLSNTYPCLVSEPVSRLKALPLSASSYRCPPIPPSRLMQDSQAVSPALVLQC